MVQVISRLSHLNMCFGICNESIDEVSSSPGLVCEIDITHCFYPAFMMLLIQAVKQSFCSYLSEILVQSHVMFIQETYTFIIPNGNVGLAETSWYQCFGHSFNVDANIL